MAIEINDIKVRVRELTPVNENGRRSVTFETTDYPSQVIGDFELWGADAEHCPYAQGDVGVLSLYLYRRQRQSGTSYYMAVRIGGFVHESRMEP